MAIAISKPYPMYLYLDRNTWVHRLHPLVRLLGMVAVFVAAYVVERPLWQLPIVAALIALLVWTGAIANIYRLRYLFGIGFVMTVSIWTLFYGPDGEPPLLVLGPLTISRTAPSYALGMALKLDSFLAAGLLFLSVTRIEEFAYALTRARPAVSRRLHDDDGVPAGAGVRRRRRRGRPGAALPGPRLRPRQPVGAGAALRAGDRAGDHGRACAAPIRWR